MRIAGHEVDFLWRAERLVVEVDGYAFHSSRATFERDRRRDTDLQATGLRVTRVSWQQLTGEPEALLARPAATLALPLHSTHRIAERDRRKCRPLPTIPSMRRFSSDPPTTSRARPTQNSRRSSARNPRRGARGTTGQRARRHSTRVWPSGTSGAST